MAVTALVAITFSCDDLEPTPKFVKSDTQFTVTPSATSVAVTAADSLDEVITFTWNDPKYAVGLENTKFRLMVGAEDQNFVSFMSKDFTGTLTGSLLGKEINAMALKFGGMIGQPITLDAKVVASQENNNEPKSSDIFQITVTPYGDLMITPSVTEVVTSAANASEEAVTLEWTTAFVGYTGVRTYQLEYAKGGTDFASPVIVPMTSLTKTYTQFELNKLALELGIQAGTEGDVDFRVKATNESGTEMYSNVATVAVTTYVAYNSIGIIGDATPGGWGTDTDMRRPDMTKPTEWTVTLYLEGGKAAKFRADDDWATNWGNSSFPTGTGLQNGPNIPVSNSGYYTVTLDVGTGAYSFTPITTTTYTYIGLIGAQSGWGSEIVDLTKSATDDQVWTGTVTLTAGELKFRADHDWGTNWGTGPGTATTSLSGYGAKNGPNISIAEAGDYFVYINVASGEYFFGKADRATAYSDIGVIGDATPGGWGSDTNIIKNPSNPYKWSGTLTLGPGEAKFRAENDWAVNWGGSAFPAGVAVQNGPNIPVTAGTYVITFNSATGEYTFTK